MFADLNICDPCGTVKPQCTPGRTDTQPILGIVHVIQGGPKNCVDLLLFKRCTVCRRVVDFPAVTVCNLNMLKASRLVNDPRYRNISGIDSKFRRQVENLVRRSPNNETQVNSASSSAGSSNDQSTKTAANTAAHSSSPGRQTRPSTRHSVPAGSRGSAGKNRAMGDDPGTSGDSHDRSSESHEKFFDARTFGSVERHIHDIMGKVRIISFNLLHRRRQELLLCGLRMREACRRARGGARGPGDPSCMQNFFLSVHQMLSSILQKCLAII